VDSATFGSTKLGASSRARTSSTSYLQGASVETFRLYVPAVNVDGIFIVTSYNPALGDALTTLGSSRVVLFEGRRLP